MKTVRPPEVAMVPPLQVNCPANTAVPVPSSVPPEKLNTVFVPKKLAPLNVSVVAARFTVKNPPFNSLRTMFYDGHNRH